jgi:hypothetical protein
MRRTLTQSRRSAPPARVGRATYCLRGIPAPPLRIPAKTRVTAERNNYRQLLPERSWAIANARCTAAIAAFRCLSVSAPMLGPKQHQPGRQRSHERAQNRENNVGTGLRSYFGGGAEATACTIVVREIPDAPRSAPSAPFSSQPPDQRPVLQSDHTPIVKSIHFPSVATVQFSSGVDTNHVPRLTACWQ